MCIRWHSAAVSLLGNIWQRVQDEQCSRVEWFFFYRRKKNSQNWKVYETTPVPDNYLVIKYLSGSRCENTVMNSSLFLLSRNSQSRREDNQAVKYRTSRPLITGPL